MEYMDVGGTGSGRKYYSTIDNTLGNVHLPYIHFYRWSEDTIV